MKMNDIPFGTTDWSTIEPTEHAGDEGTAYWRTRQFGAIRVRMVEYTPGYVANHWCSKGHILFCIEGELRTELEGRPSLRAPARHELSGRGQRRGASLVDRARRQVVSSSTSRAGS
jgi:hypothetical protein